MTALIDISGGMKLLHAVGLWPVLYMTANQEQKQEKMEERQEAEDAGEEVDEDGDQGEQEQTQGAEQTEAEAGQQAQAGSSGSSFLCHSLGPATSETTSYHAKKVNAAPGTFGQVAAVKQLAVSARQSPLLRSIWKHVVCRLCSMCVDGEQKCRGKSCFSSVCR